METNDETLMTAHKAGDPAAFGALVGRYAGPLLGYLIRLVGDRHHAEDVFQETFSKVHAKRETFRDGARFKPWLFTIATRRAIDLLRKRQRGPLSVSLDDENVSTGFQRDVVDDAPDPGVEFARKEVKEQVRAAVEMLPERQRAALLLSYYHGLTYPEVADAMECSLGTVKTHMSRALKALAVRLPDVRGEMI